MEEGGAFEPIFRKNLQGGIKAESRGQGESHLLGVVGCSTAAPDCNPPLPRGDVGWLQANLA